MPEVDAFGVFSSYRDILSLPGALAFSIAGVLARAPMALQGMSMILMVRAVYGSYTLAGLVGAIGIIAYAICAPILARLVDRHGQAKIMLPSITIASVATLGIILTAWVAGPIWIVMVLAVVAGATAGSIGALVRARWAHVVKNSGQLQSAYAMEAAFDELVFVLGPVIATISTATIHPTAGLILTLCFMVFGSMAFLLQRSTEPPVTPKVRGQKQKSVMANPAMIVLALTFVGTGALFGALDLSVVANADAAGLPSLAGAILGTMSLGSLVAALIYGARVWNISLTRLFLIGVVLLAVGVSTFVLAPNLWILLPLMFIAGMSVAPTMTNVNTVVQHVVAPSRLTEGLTWMSTAMTLGVSLGSAVSGPVIDAYGHPGGFLVVAAFGWLMVLAAVLGYAPLRRAIRRADQARSRITNPRDFAPEEALEISENNATTVP